MVASANGSSAQAVADASLCYVALAVLFFAGTVTVYRIRRKMKAGSGA